MLQASNISEKKRDCVAELISNSNEEQISKQKILRKKE